MSLAFNFDLMSDQGIAAVPLQLQALLSLLMCFEEEYQHAVFCRCMK